MLKQDIRASRAKFNFRFVKMVNVNTKCVVLFPNL